MNVKRRGRENEGRHQKRPKPETALQTAIEQNTRVYCFTIWRTRSIWTDSEILNVVGGVFNPPRENSLRTTGTKEGWRKKGLRKN